MIDQPADTFPLALVDVSAERDPVAAAANWSPPMRCCRSPWRTARRSSAMLIRVAPDEHVLMLSVHHVVFDEWSDQVFPA
ncbi:hypothetical protein A4E84_04290 [Streptomyces qaidamensis]|uniref:Condensation domain-containing protein n=1 Tax=Streptomyces qaidamensis TaxID=1783515 RepID=A0A143BU51_9ACTN|nr:hypothetical protein [Streptomyces qaidamensis]AMW08788.1 hypothetical protein A4E84_04290 [Streptomyces qaidamensis]